MLRDSIQSGNKYFKVLYGPLDHIFYITLHNRPYKNFVLYDEQYRQIKKIDVSNVSLFQSRCVNLESTFNLKNRKNIIHTTKYVLEIYFGNGHKNPLVFTLLSFNDSQVLTKEIENVFGVRVYSYGSLNSAFKNALKNVNEPQFITNNPELDYDRAQKYQLYKDAHDLKNLYELAQLDYDEQSEPVAELSNKHPVLIEGNLENGSFVSYRDIRMKHNLTDSVYKVEWYLSRSVGNADEFFQIPYETSDTFYLSEYMIGHYIMVKVYRALKSFENRLFVYSTAQKGPIYPNTQLCHHILLNSSRKTDFHDTLISTLDLDLLFSIVDSSNKFGLYKPFNKPELVSNYAKIQSQIKFQNENINIHTEDSDNTKSEQPINNNKSENQENSNAVSPTNENTVKPSGNDFDFNAEDNNTTETNAVHSNETTPDENEINNISLDLFDYKPEVPVPRYNNIKLKVLSKDLNTQDSLEDCDEEDKLIIITDLDDENKRSLNFLYGMKMDSFKDIHETTTVSDLTDYNKDESFESEEYSEPEKSRFSILNLFKSNKKRLDTKNKQKQPLRNKKPPMKPMKKGAKDINPNSNPQGILKNKNKRKSNDSANDNKKSVLNHTPEIKMMEVDYEQNKMVIKEVKPENAKNVAKKPPVKGNKPPNKDVNFKKEKFSLFKKKGDKQPKQKKVKTNAVNESVTNSESGDSQPEDIEKPKPKNVKFASKVSKKPDKQPLKSKKQMDENGKKEIKPVKGAQKLKPKKVVNNVKEKKKLKDKKMPPKEPLIETEREMDDLDMYKPVNHKNKKKKPSFFGLFDKKKNQFQKVYPHPNNELLQKKKQEDIDAENLQRLIDTIKFVPVKLKICLNELILTFGLSSLSLKWRMVDVEKADQLTFDQFPTVQKQLQNNITIVYNTEPLVKVSFRTQSTFQRNVIFHSILFNKYRTNYSIDRCDRDLENCYYNGIQKAYTKVCSSLYESKKRNEDKKVAINEDVKR